MNSNFLGLINRDFFHSLLTSPTLKKNDYSEFFLQYKNTTIYVFNNSSIKYKASNVDNGINFSTCKNDYSTFSCTGDLSYKSILNIVTPENHFLEKSDKSPVFTSDSFIKPFINIDAIVEHILFSEKESRKNFPEILELNSNLVSDDTDIMIVNTDDGFISDDRSKFQYTVTVIAKIEGKIVTGFSGFGRREISGLTENQIFWKINSSITNAIRQAHNSVYGKRLIQRSLPVVFDSGLPATLFHEAIGHGLEVDNIIQKKSIYSDKIGQRIANEKVTLVDDASIQNIGGSQTYDDEGTLTKENILIQDGELKNYLLDKSSARALGGISNGSGRRMSFRHNALPRMSNTYIKPGIDERSDIINSIEDGVIIKSFGNGRVDTLSGKFTLKILEGYRIRKGKISEPIKDNIITGIGSEVINNVSMISNNLQFDNGLGCCNKLSQVIPVGLGQPTVKIESINVE